MTTPTPASPVLPSFIRTYSPMLVGFIVGWLVDLGVSLSPTQEAVVTSAVTTVAGAVYYAICRVLERKWPFLSVLLGSKKQPTYTS